MKWQTDLSLSEPERLFIASCQFNTKRFCTWLFPDRFHRPFGTLHDEVFSRIDATRPDGLPAHQQVCLAAPRGTGKTSICSLGKPAQAILYGTHKFIVLLGPNQDASIEKSENLKAALLEPRVRQYFFDVRVATKDGIEEFGKESWVAQTPFGGIRVLPMGARQSIRGRLHGSFRPSLIVCDDIEDIRTIDNEEIRKDTRTWFFGDVMYAMDRPAKSWQVIYIDTLKHEDALVEELLSKPDWESARLSICTPDYKSLYPEFVTDEELAHEIELHRQAGTMDVFGRERMNEPIAREAASFKQEFFKYYDESKEQLDKRPGLENVVLVDIAKTTNPESAFSAVVGWGVDTRRGALYVRDIDAGRMHPEDLYKRAIDMAVRLRASVIGLEVTGLNEFVTYPFQTYMTSQGHNFEIIELKARSGEGEFAGKGRGKYGRIASLIPFYRQGLIWHNKTCCGPLETQLLSFPKSKRLDVMDAAAYIVEILDMGGRFFLPQRKAVDNPQPVGHNTSDEYDGWWPCGSEEEEFGELTDALTGVGSRLHVR